MNKTLMKKWAKALRSGKYKQGRHSLRNKNDTFCCLGVLCDISGMGEWTGDDKTVFSISGKQGIVTATSCLPYVLENEITPPMNSLGHREDVESELIRINDDDINPASFEEIADVIDLLILAEEK